MSEVRDIDQAARQLARSIAMTGQGTVEWAPGSGTLFRILIQEPKGEEAVQFTGNRYLVALTNLRKCAALGLRWSAPSYVAEKLDLLDQDAQDISDLLTRVGGILYPAESIRNTPAHAGGEREHA